VVARGAEGVVTALSRRVEQQLVRGHVSRSFGPPASGARQSGGWRMTLR
jgi:hypothetical protein